MKRTIIPYNPKLKRLAKKLRADSTLSEVVLWNELKNGRMMGYDFDRQRPIGNYIVDFYSKDISLVIEVDGITHQQEHVKKNDIIRQQKLESLHVSFLRFNALLVLNKIEAVVREISEWILNYEKINGVNENVQRKRMKLERIINESLKDPPRCL